MHMEGIIDFIVRALWKKHVFLKQTQWRILGEIALTANIQIGFCLNVQRYVLMEWPRPISLHSIIKVE